MTPCWPMRVGPGTLAEGQTAQAGVAAGVRCLSHLLTGLPGTRGGDRKMWV